MLTIPQVTSILKSQEQEWWRYRQIYEQIQRFITPYQGKFTISGEDQKDKSVTQPLFAIEPTALKALKVMAAGLQAGTTSRTRPWFSIQTDDPEFNRWPVMAQWIHEVKTKMYAAIDKSNYYACTQNQYLELGAFGTAGMSIMPGKNGGIVCHSFTAGEYMISLDDEYAPNVFSRKYYFTVRQLVEKYGIDKVSRQVKDLWDKEGSDRDQEIQVVNCIMPNAEADTDSNSKLKMPWISYTWEWGNGKQVSEYKAEQFLNVGGYRERPVMTPRWQTHSDQVYGVSPSMDLLGRIKVLHKADEKYVKAMDKTIDPPLNAPMSARNRQFANSVGLPNHVAYVQNVGEGVTPQYMLNFDFATAQNKIYSLQQEIKDGYFNNIFITLMASQDDPVKTATEIVKRDEERLAQLGPVLERIHSEQIGPSVDRIFQIMLDAGELPEPPQELYSKNLTIEYTSVVAEALKSLSVNNQERFAAYVGNVAQYDPTVLDVVDFDESARDYAQKMSIEPDQLKDPEIVAQERQARAQAQQQAQQAEMMAQASQSAKNLSETPIDQEGSALNAMMNQ